MIKMEGGSERDLLSLEAEEEEEEEKTEGSMWIVLLNPVFLCGGRLLCLQVMKRTRKPRSVARRCVVCLR